MLYFMWRSRVPELASWKSDCAWLRSIVQRAMIINASPRSESFDPDSISTESITIEHLRALHGLFVSPATTAAEEVYKMKEGAKPKEPERINGAEHRSLTVTGLGQRALTVRHRTEGQTVRFQTDFPDADTPRSVEVAPSTDSPALDDAQDEDAPPEHDSLQAEPTARQLVGSAMITSGALGVPQATRLELLNSQAADAAAETGGPVVRRRWSTRLQRGGRGSTLTRSSSENWFLALLRRLQEEIGLEVTRMATKRAKTLRKTLSTMLYSNERTLLLKALLEWAKHDKLCLVSEPRHNQMRWRTQYEWQALRVGNIQLGDHDAAERAGARSLFWPHARLDPHTHAVPRSLFQVCVHLLRLFRARLVLGGGGPGPETLSNVPYRLHRAAHRRASHRGRHVLLCHAACRRAG